MPGRAAMTIFTGHRTTRWYPVLMVCDEYGSVAPQILRCEMLGTGVTTNRVDSMLVSSRENSDWVLTPGT